MKRILILATLLFGLLSPLAYGDTYVVCYQKAAMPGINQFGEQASCVKCTGAVPSERLAWAVCPNGQGETFNSVDDAENWKARNCTCP